MGCWDETCALTHTGIRAGEACYAVVYYADPRQNPKHPRYMQPRQLFPGGGTEAIAKHGQPECAYTTRDMDRTLWRLRTQDVPAARNAIASAQDTVSFLAQLRGRDRVVAAYAETGAAERLTLAEESLQDADASLLVTVLRGTYDDYGGLDLEDGGIWRPEDLPRHTYFLVRADVADALVEMVAKFKGDPKDAEATWVERLLLAAFYARAEVFTHAAVCLGPQFTSREELRVQGLLHRHKARILREQRAFLKG